MTTPESAGRGLDQPWAGPRPAAKLPDGPLGRPAGSSPDETPTAPQPTTEATGEPATTPPPATGARGEQPTGPGRPAEPGVPPWSTPATVATAPPLGGAPPRPAGPPGTPPGAADEPPEPEHHGPRPWLILGAAALFLLCCYGGLGLAAITWGGDLIRAVRDRTERAVAVGELTRDGNLEFRVRQVQCGITEIGDPIVNQTAVGQFCVVQLDVHNLGRQPATFTDTLQRAYGPRNQQFTADPGAGILANADQTVFMSDINPGQQVSGAIVYDIPENSRIVRLRLHSAANTDGALVKV